VGIAFTYLYNIAGTSPLTQFTGGRTSLLIAVIAKRPLTFFHAPHTSNTQLSQPLHAVIGVMFDTSFKRATIRTTTLLALHAVTARYTLR
jgi:hypothetical protein